MKLLKYLLVALVGLFALHNAYDIDEWHNLISEMATNASFIEDFDNNVRELLAEDPDYFDYVPKINFNCKMEPSPVKPTSVHKLRPGDINVVAALGDSLTASLGSKAKTILGLLIEYRGRSWSIGGDDSLDKLITLPNILKKFNPNLKGYTLGKDVSFLTKQGKGLNVAVSGQEANHIPDQARRLVQRLKEDKSVDFENDWKMVTLFIGGNDLCRYCDDMNKHSPKAYINDIQQGLDILYKQLPRTFVNLVSVLRVQDVKLLNKGLVCKTLHKFGCSCAAYPKSAEAEKTLVSFQQAYQQGVEDLINSKRYDGRDDFTVVVQPFLKEMTIPRNAKGNLDFTFFAPDCFHMSTKGHSSAAIGLWNNLFQPIGRKDTTWKTGEQLDCPPTSHPYFYTNKN